MEKEKKVLNGEQIRAKEQKQFILVYIIGLVAFIVLMVALNNNFNQDYVLKIDSKILKAPNVINVSEENRKGKELLTILDDYNDLVSKVNELKLDQLNLNEFVFSEEIYHYVDNNYTYEANDNYIHLTRQSKDVYIASMESDIVKVSLYAEKDYYLEYSKDLISFKVNEDTYEIRIENNQYILESNYQMNGQTVVEEIYDSSFNLVNIKTSYQENDYIGYFFSDLEYTLSENKTIIYINDEEYLSTKYNDDDVIYYTVIEYTFDLGNKDYLLLVNTNNEFPFK